MFTCRYMGTRSVSQNTCSRAHCHTCTLPPCAERNRAEVPMGFHVPAGLPGHKMRCSSCGTRQPWAAQKACSSRPAIFPSLLPGVSYRDDLWGAESQLLTDNRGADGSQGTAVIELHPAGGLASEWPVPGPKQCGAPEASKTLGEEDSNTTAPGVVSL